MLTQSIFEEWVKQLYIAQTFYTRQRFINYKMIILAGGSLCSLWIINMNQQWTQN